MTYLISVFFVYTKLETVSPGQPNTMHEKNEGLHVRLIDTWMELYLEAIYQLAK